ncbi:hypothetical protein KPL71_021535 [Citrus sinensis]|uniref:Uncharacterized protein n=1 Tax=Citrus sinensis TaxID=2711 RepID=A0ACB8JFI4_CITSI|nr:hypothetical protein KPL71_021535 [Citrus sinensis]
MYLTHHSDEIVVATSLMHNKYSSIWDYGGAHIVISSLYSLTTIWHWVYWDLAIFVDDRTGKRSLDLPKIFGIHLFLSGVACFGFGTFHISNLYGLIGKVQFENPAWGVEDETRNSNRRKLLGCTIVLTTTKKERKKESILLSK